MSLRVKNKKKPSLPPIDGGTHPAVCVGIVDLGEQYSENYKKYEDKVLLIWELPGVTVEVDGEQKPRWLSKDFSATLTEKSNLYKFLVPWRGKNFTDEELNGVGFNLKQMLGQGCLLQVIVEEKDGNQYNRVTGCVGFPVGMPAPSTESELICFDMDEWDDDVMAKLPEWMQNKIKKSTQYATKHAPTDAVEVKTGAGAEAEVPAKASAARPYGGGAVQDGVPGGVKTPPYMGAVSGVPARDCHVGADAPPRNDIIGGAYAGGQGRPPLQTNNGSTTRSGGVPF